MNGTIFGACYYPEHWDRGSWDQQIELMAAANFNTVRIGDLAWASIEPEEGRFDFEWMDEAIDKLAKKDIKVILCTPTATPPKWLVDQYDVVQRDRYGRAKGFGSRRECCANNSDFRKKSAIIAEEMAKHFSHNKNIIAWQIDNEFGCHNSTRCYCESCRQKFSVWLQNKYVTIEKLNKQWGNVFWGLDIPDFSSAYLPAYTACEPENEQAWAHNPSLDLEFRRFASDSWVDYQKMQQKILTKYIDLPMTHNFMGHFSDLDYYDLGRDLDFVSWDNYPDNQWGTSEYAYVSMAHENMRGIKNKNFIVSEEQSGPCGWDTMGSTPRPGQIRLWTHQAIAHGGSGILYFRFQTPRFGMEQYWHGILDHDGVTRRRYFEVQGIGQELDKLDSKLISAENKYEALIVKSYDDVWSHEIKRHAPAFDYRNLLYSYYKANAALNINTAVSNSDFNKYKVIYLPACNMIDQASLEEIKRFCSKGRHNCVDVQKRNSRRFQ